MKTPHLNDEQFSAYLIDPAEDEAVSEHLAACPVCREELDQFRLSVSAFNEETLAWGNARAGNAAPIETMKHKRWTPGLGWALTACALAAIFLSSSLRDHMERAHIHSSIATATNSQENSAEQIAQDNRMLAEVYEQINQPVSVPVAEYGLASGHASTSHSRAAARMD